jgi:hypothetical protein
MHVIRSYTAFVHKVPRLSLLKKKREPLEHIFLELPNIYLSRDIKPVSKLDGQMY